jgi:hypothetical protein
MQAWPTESFEVAVIVQGDSKSHGRKTATRDLSTGQKAWKVYEKGVSWKMNVM